MSFTHLHVHTVYSRFDGLAKIEDLFKRASEMNQPGLAITDHGTMSGVPEFLQVAEKYPDVKPVVGCEFYLADGDICDQPKKSFHLILLAKNPTGYRTLVKLCSIAGTEGFYNGKAHIDHQALQEHHEGVIALSSCIGGEIPQAILNGNMDRARGLVLWYNNLYGKDFYLEVSAHQSKKPYYKGNLYELQQKANNAIFNLGKEFGIKVVATNDVHMTEAADSVAHEALLCCNTKARQTDENRFFYTGEEYLKSEEAMLGVFAGHQEAVYNTKEVLNKIDLFDIRRKTEYPNGFSSTVEILEDIADTVSSQGGIAQVKSPNTIETDRIGFDLALGIISWHFGLGHVARVTTIPRRYFKAAIRDAFKAYGLPLSSADNLISLIGHTAVPMPSPRELLQRPDIAKWYKSASGTERMAFDAADMLDRTILPPEIHSCAFLISRSEISSLLPLTLVKDAETNETAVCSQYESKYVHEMGALKFCLVKNAI